MHIISINDAIEQFSYSETHEFEPQKLKEAWVLPDTHRVAFVSSDYEEAVIAEAREALAQEIIFATIAAGKMRLLGRQSSDRPRDTVAYESVELAEIETKDVREGSLDWIDGELTLTLSPESEEESAEIVDLHLIEEEFESLFRDVRNFRRLQSCLDYGLQSYEPETNVVPLAAPTIAAEHECAKWFREQVETADVDEFAGKKALWREAKERFPRLSWRGFVRVWNRDAPQEWKRAGRKRGLKSSRS